MRANGSKEDLNKLKIKKKRPKPPKKSPEASAAEFFSVGGH